MLFLEAVEVCKNPSILRVIYFGKSLLGLLSIVIPIYLIISITIGVTKQLINAGDNKVNWKLYSNKFISAIIIFVVPWSINLFMKIINENTRYVSCIANANLSTIEHYQKLEDIRFEEEKKKEEEEKKKQEEANKETEFKPNRGPNCHQLDDLEPLSNKEFIEYLAPFAIKEYKISGILPSVTIAQAITETGWGNKPIKTSNNLFNIKCGSWKGRKMIFDNGAIKNDCFRGYDCIEDSFKDRTKLFQQKNFTKQKITETKDYRKQIDRIFAGGYGELEMVPVLKKIVEQNNLTRFDK